MVYALGRDLGESARLQRQSEELRAHSAALLDRTGLGPGQAAIDLGCGPRNPGPARRAGLPGRVAGLEADPAHVAVARQFAAQSGLGGVEVVAGVARRTGLPGESFDLVHARTCWSTSPSPAT